MQVRAADHPEPVTPFGRAFDQAGVGEEIAADANFAREGQIDFAVVRKRQEFKPIQEIVALTYMRDVLEEQVISNCFLFLDYQSIY